MGIFGIFGKVLPWKRKDELGLNENLGLGGFGGPQDLGLGGVPFGQPQQQQGMPGPGGVPQYPVQLQQNPQMEAFASNQAYERSYAAGKEMEIVSAKLDAIRAGLEALNQRLSSIERYLQLEQDFKKRGW